MTAEPLNWLSLVGLFWLEEGDNSFGAHETNKIVLTALAHKRSGVFRLEDGRVSLVPEEDRELRVNGRFPDARLLRADRDGEPDLIETGSLAMRVIRRDERTLLRVWDKEAPSARRFAGLNYYPIKPEHRIVAEFVPYNPPRITQVRTVIGTAHDDEFVGQARFRWDGVECRLEAQGAGEGLLFSFTDRTNGDTTYPGGRFVKAPRPEGGQVTLDFNLASNWPCAYTSFATCPIPPAENRLAVRIEAGEMKYHG
jgi:hypothetical protein